MITLEKAFKELNKDKSLKEAVTNYYDPRTDEVIGWEDDMPEQDVDVSVSSDDLFDVLKRKKLYDRIIPRFKNHQDELDLLNGYLEKYDTDKAFHDEYYFEGTVTYHYTPDNSWEIKPFTGFEYEYTHLTKVNREHEKQIKQIMKHIEYCFADEFWLNIDYYLKENK